MAFPSQAKVEEKYVPFTFKKHKAYEDEAVPISEIKFANLK